MRPEVIEGDVREVLKTLDDESVQCVVTSPPYWGLRDYGVDDQLGLEPTPEKYVENMVSVFQEVKRVLRKDGTVWLNLGDSYAGSNSTKDAVIDKDSLSYKAGHFRGGVSKSVNSKVEGLKPKDLVGIPWRVAFALQADGWWLRSDIIWNKPNPMPESVTDRPTKSHEYIFLLTKSPKYYYDYEAIKENTDVKGFRGGSKVTFRAGKEQLRNDKEEFTKDKEWFGRNKRSVWKMNTKPYKEAHFATFPEELPKTCIKAGTSKAGCCADCGSPYERITDREPTEQDKILKQVKGMEIKHANPKRGGQRVTSTGSVPSYEKPDITTIGWEPTCDCNADKVPCVVLDIFAGSGTTLRVASKLGRKGIGIELNPEYIKILKKRCKIESASLEAFV